MKKIMKIIMIGILVVPLFLTACAGSAGTQPPPVPATPKQSIQLESCLLGDIAAQCGELSVYENRATNTGRMIGIHVAVIKASSSSPKPDPIFYVAGGPGGSGINDAPYAMLVLKSASQDRDLVLFDQRGTGQSNRMTCPRQMDEALGLVPFDDRMLQDLKSCLAHINGDPRTYTTAWGMDDLDDLRVALGYDQINLYGESYGPLAEQVYLQRHGEHVRTMTLEGVSLLDAYMFERMPRSSQEVLDLLFARCKADEKCNTAYPNFREEVTALIAQLEKKPVELSFINPYTQEPVRLTRDWLVLGIHNVLLATPTAVMLPSLLHQAYLGNWTRIEAMLENNFGSPKPEWSVMNLAILCHEDWARTRRAETDQMSVGSYLRYGDVRNFLAPEKVCGLMPDLQPEALYQPVTVSSTPVLILSNQADPQNPLANLATAKAHYPNSLVLQAPGQGHGYSGFECRDQILSDFINNGTTQGLKADCLQNVPLPDFVFP